MMLLAVWWYFSCISKQIHLSYYCWSSFFFFHPQCMSANVNLFLLAWYKGSNRTITTALLLMNTNLITPLFFNRALCYSKKHAGISAADTAIPVNLAPQLLSGFYPLPHLLFAAVKQSRWLSQSLNCLSQNTETNQGQSFLTPSLPTPVLWW